MPASVAASIFERLILAGALAGGIHGVPGDGILKGFRENYSHRVLNGICSRVMSRKVHSQCLKSTVRRMWSGVVLSGFFWASSALAQGVGVLDAPEPDSVWSEVGGAAVSVWDETGTTDTPPPPPPKKTPRKSTRTQPPSEPVSSSVVEEALAASTEPLSPEESRRLLVSARAAFEDGLFPVAERRLEQVLARSPDHRRQCEAVVVLAQLHLAQGRAGEALAALERCEAPGGGSVLRGEYLFWQARALAELDRQEEALALLEDIRANHVDVDTLPATLRLMVRCRAALQEWEKADVLCRELEQGWPDHEDAPEAWFDLASLLSVHQDSENALAILEHIQTVWPGQKWDERSLLLSAEVQLKEGRLADSDAVALAALADNPALALDVRIHAYQVLAKTYSLDENWTNALKMAQQAVDLAPPSALRLDNEWILVQLEVLSGAVDHARRDMGALIRRVPALEQAAMLQMDFAELLLESGYFTAAADEYQVWLESFPDVAPERRYDAWWGKGVALLELARHAEAASAFDQAVKWAAERPARLRAKWKWADVQFMLKHYSPAEAVYLELLDAIPRTDDRYARVAYQLAETELALGKTEKGEIRLLDLSRAKEETEFSRKATMRAGGLYEERGALVSAMEQYGRIIKNCAEPESCAEALLARGMLRYRLGDFKEALEDFTRIHDDMPGSRVFEQAFFMRGWCQYLLGREEEAVAICSRFVADYPQSAFAADVQFWLAEYALNHGNPAEAEMQFARVAAVWPDSPRAADALFWAGRVAMMQREYLRANEHFNTLIQRHPQSPRLPETLIAQGDVLSERGHFAEAILAFDEVIVQFPQSREALMAWGRKGDCQYTMGNEEPRRYEEAFLSYQMLRTMPDVTLDMRLQAEYKMGRCLEKLNRLDAALEQYIDVVYAFLQEPQRTADGTVWFTRSAFAAAVLQERFENWKEAVAVYQRVIDAQVPSADEARVRVARIQREHWTLF